jgi:hypothetical protein
MAIPFISLLMQISSPSDHRKCDLLLNESVLNEIGVIALDFEFKKYFKRWKKVKS